MALFDGRTGTEILDPGYAGPLPPEILAILRQYAGLPVAPVKPPVTNTPVNTGPAPAPPLENQPVKPPISTAPIAPVPAAPAYDPNAAAAAAAVSGFGGGGYMPLPTAATTGRRMYSTLPAQVPSAAGPLSSTRPAPAPVDDPGFGVPVRQLGGGSPMLPRVPPRGVGATGLGFADGGPIVGPGGPRDDNLLIAASNGEVIVPADVVRAKGTEFFEKLKENVRQKALERNGPGFADGGPVVHGYADGGYIDESEGLDYLPASSSPGLAPLPPEGAPIQAPAPAADLPAAAPIQPARPATSGMGMADFKAARNEDDMEYLRSLPTQQKIGLALEAFGSGVTGAPNPVDRILESKRRREAEFRAELGTTLQTITAGMKAVKDLPPGKARDALIEQIGRAAGANKDVVVASLMAAGTAEEQEITNIVSVLQNPRAQAMVVKASGGDPQTARKLMSDSDFMKRLEATADQDTLPAVTAKLNILTRAMEKMPQFKSAEGGVSFTMADLREQNAALPKEFQLSDAELATANRNQDTLIKYGLKTDKTQQAEQESKAKKAEAGKWSEPYSLNGATVQKNLTTGEIRTAVPRAPKDEESEGQVVEIADPNDSTKSIKVFSKSGRKVGDAPPKAARNIPGPVLTAMATNAGNIRRAQTALDLLEDKDVTMKGPSGNDIVLKGDKEATGFKGYWPDWIVQRADKQGIDARAQIADLGSMVIHDRSGAAVTAAEFPRLRPFIPSDKDDPETARKKLRRFVAEYTAINEDMKGMFSEDQGYRQPPGAGAPRDGKDTAPKTSTAALPLPSSKVALKKGQKYQTARGEATWDGEKFVQ